MRSAGVPEGWTIVSGLLRTLASDEALREYIGCCWTWRDESACCKTPVFRLATPHGQLDYCAEHIDYAIVSLPPEWLEGFAYREPVTVEAGDDIPF